MTALKNRVSGILCAAVLLTLATPPHADEAIQNATSALLKSVQTARGLETTAIKDPNGGGGTGGGDNGGNNGGGPTVTAEAFFAAEVHTLIYPRCYSACHTAGGVSQAQGSRLIIEGPGVNQVMLNFQAFREYITEIASGEVLLEKIANSNPLSPHGGAQVYAEGSEEYNTIAEFTAYY